MNQIRYLLILFALLALPLSPAVAKDKEEKASKVIKKSIKTFLKQKSYAVDCHVRGGISSSKQHDMSEVIVDKTYSGQSLKKIVKVSSPEAYRRGEKGAIFDDKKGFFLSILANDAGTEMKRLFKLPEAVLANVYKSAKKAEWLVAPASSNGSADNDKSDRDGPVTQAGDSEETAVDEFAEVTVKNPVIRVTLPAKISLKTFVEIENSGCMGGG